MAVDVKKTGQVPEMELRAEKKQRGSIRNKNKILRLLKI